MPTLHFRPVRALNADRSLIDYPRMLADGAALRGEITFVNESLVVRLVEDGKLFLCANVQQRTAFLNNGKARLPYPADPGAPQVEQLPAEPDETVGESNL